MDVTFNKEELITNGITSFHLFNFAEQSIILNEIKKHTLTKAPVQLGKASQYFNEGSLRLRYAPKTFNYIRKIRQYLHLELKEYLPWWFSFTEMRIQQYSIPEKDHRVESGISRHRDHKRYRGIIVILVIEDGGEFLVYDPDRRRIPTESGYCIVMKGSEFGKEKNDIRLRHAVENVDYSRTTIGLRFDYRFTLWGLILRMLCLV